MAARILPLFPLPVVLFPGVQIPLHIFEPRYRLMLADCLAGDRRFGLVYCPPGLAERALPPGQVGCVAEIDEAEELPDGRSNIMVTGSERFSLVSFVDSAHPYHLGEVADYRDIPEPAAPLAELASTVRDHFDRIARAITTIANENAPPPDLPEEPTLLAFRVASLIDIGAPARQELLTSRSASQRLRDIGTLLDAALASLERGARTHVQARSNGSGHGTAEPTS
ncbi:MAG TPA: LON peptidase substrate-binding domain-containing protein [Gemmatimonadaceae bacterium]|nr:LON peptidase substrate-binding domain-containing protein [Gemmatimonadaceae bacterium]